MKLLSYMDNYPQIPVHTGATVGAWCFNKAQQRSVLDDIKKFVQNVGSDFNDVLRVNQQGGRYTYLTFIISNPKKKSKKYINTRVIGLFYEDTQQVNNIRFKQDFVLSQYSEYTFIVGDRWLKKFPNLSQYSNYIWNFKKFDGEIANGQHYQNNGQFNHHYKTIEDLPLEVAKYL